jgi:hypothetical protein
MRYLGANTPSALTRHDTFRLHPTLVRLTLFSPLVECEQASAVQSSGARGQRVASERAGTRGGVAVKKGVGRGARRMG